MSQMVAPRCARCSRSTLLACQTMWLSWLTGALIMPAPTVRLVASSMRMKLPVSRLRRYESNMTGSCVRRVTRPISLSDSASAFSSRCSELTSSR